MVLLDVAANEAVLTHLRRRARPGGRDPEWDLDGWELHVHPDLADRLLALAPPGERLSSVYGVRVLASHGIAAAFVEGTSSLLLRLPRLPEGLLGPSAGYIPQFQAPGWCAVDPWQTQPAGGGLSQLRAAVAVAHRAASQT